MERNYTLNEYNGYNIIMSSNLFAYRYDVHFHISKFEMGAFPLSVQFKWRTGPQLDKKAGEQAGR